MAQVIWNPDIDVYNSSVMPLSVAKNIAKYLPIGDILNFGAVSKNANLAIEDSTLWLTMAKSVGVWSNNPEKNIPYNDTRPFTGLDCMDGSISDPKVARSRILAIYRCLDKYYTDLLSNKSYDKLKIFQDYHTPEEQCKILNNLMKYSNLDKIEESKYLAQEKLNSLFEIFENAILRELEIHFDLEDYKTMNRFVKVFLELNNHQTLIDFFIQKSVLDNSDTMFDLIESIDVDKFFIEEAQEDGNMSFKLAFGEFDGLMKELVVIFEHESRIIDMVFPQTIPMMYKVSEELILNQLGDRFNSLVESSKPKSLYLAIVPYLYKQLQTNFVDCLGTSKNLGEGYHNLIQELIDMQFEQTVTDYIREELVLFKGDAYQRISEWKKSIEKREEETSQSILRNVRSETKNDFLSSFKKAFTVSSSTNSEIREDSNDTYSEIQAKEKILTENMKSINKTFSLKLSMEILNEGKLSLARILHFEQFSIASLRNSVLTSVQEIFISLLESIGNEHLRPGFDKALLYLRTYKPNEDHESAAVEPIKPLVLFSDLVNIADLIIQMVEIFYKEEIINRHLIKHENSILNPALQRKKKFEEMVDNYVADGLNIGLDVLISEIELTYSSVIESKDYLPDPIAANSVEGPTSAAQRVIQILNGNFDLLVGCADKSVIDVFQQELAERFFQVIVKIIKRTTISNMGAVTLISDLNLYYDCIFTHIKTNKRLILPLFQSLKKVGSIYLISGDDSKSIGKLVSDLSKFNGIFNQEEIYEFVQRREDWNTVKSEVEKIMYGLSLGDCTIV
ncbi:recyclin-1 [[Candida] jaroonii]|uniref:Recyclin-1 n=1 Tax=[Candida] jaroonii TaxID=467808 RepID=A0ACA9Y1J3_9ASCO|nr:recyclin-1 [[Candida] jaroonii]